MSESLERIAEELGISREKLGTCSEALRESIFNWAVENYAQAFIDFHKKKANSLMEEVNKLSNPFRNGWKGKEYSAELVLPEGIKDPKVVGLEGSGLECHLENETARLVVSGTPSVDGKKEIILEYSYAGAVEGMSPCERTFQFVINPDPRAMWKDVEVPKDIEYYKDDTEIKFVKGEPEANGTPGKNMVAASRRGRSHAHEGKPRDDDFELCYCQESGWYILAVADGAGSAEFSREGARLACQAAVKVCQEKLEESKNDFDAFLKTTTLNNPGEKSEEQLSDDDCPEETDAVYANRLPIAAAEQAFHREEQQEEQMSEDIKIKNEACKIVAEAARAAYDAIQKEAKDKGRQIKDYATTLLMTICKKFSKGYLIISFNIGDGAIGIIFKEKDCFKIQLNCTPDEGEFSGQTRFVTMGELSNDDTVVLQRIHVARKQDFQAVMLMTDGVSDAKFETRSSLNSEERWKDVWEDINSHLQDNNESSAKNLLEWLNFWSRGNHDDRTIAILY